jgi:hypothetical protein
MKRICLEGAKDAHGADCRLRIGAFSSRSLIARYPGLPRMRPGRSGMSVFT